MQRHLTGWHVLAIFVGAFTIIVGVNVAMAVQAVRTFPGLEAESSYADSQDFDLRRAAQEALGWEAELEVLDGRLRLHLTDASGPAHPAAFTALLTRATNAQDDQDLALERVNGAFEADADLAPGLWRLRLEGEARDGTAYRHAITFRIP